MKLFDEGWNKVAARILENQKRLGVVLPNAKLPPCPSGTRCRPTRSSSTWRQIGVWAAYMAYTDHEVGCVIDTIEKLGQLDNMLMERRATARPERGERGAPGMEEDRSCVGASGPCTTSGRRPLTRRSAPRRSSSSAS